MRDLLKTFGLPLSLHYSQRMPSTSQSSKSVLDVSPGVSINSLNFNRFLVLLNQEILDT